MFNFISNAVASVKSVETTGTIAQAPSVETAGTVAYSGSFNAGSSSTSSCGSSFCAVA